MTSLARFIAAAVAVLLPASLLHAALAERTDKPAAQSLAGQFLIASPSIGDPRFAQTVILMVQHSQTGALGIVINRPVGERSLATLFEVLGEKRSGGPGLVRIFAGGPVQPNVGFVVHSADYEVPDTTKIDARLSMTSNLQVLRDIASGGGPKKSLIAFGYAGWAAGQLEGELARNAWFTAPADPSIVFDIERDEVWDRAMERRTRDL